MAEFCLDCLNEDLGTNYSASNFYLSDEPELCEGCGKLKRVVIAERPSLFLELIFLPLTFPFKLISFLYRHFKRLLK